MVSRFSFIHYEQFCGLCRSAAVFSGMFFVMFGGVSSFAENNPAAANRVSLVKPVQSAEKPESETGFAVAGSNEMLRAQKSDSSLINNLSSMFRKDEKTASAPVLTAAEPRIIKRRPMAEPLAAEPLESPETKPVAAEPDPSETDEDSSSLSSLSFEEIQTMGDTAYEEGDSESAENCYRELVLRCSAQDGIEEQLAVPYHRLGVIERDRQEYGKAQEYLVLAIKSDPEKNPQITFDYAVVLYEIGKFERAKKLFSYLEEKCPEMTEARRYKGLCVLNLDPEDSEAFDCLNETVGREEACTLIREKCLELGKTEKAAEMDALLVSNEEENDQIQITSLPANGAEQDPAAGDAEIELGGVSANAETADEPIGLETLAADSQPDETAPAETITGLSQDQTTHVNSPVINLETLGPKQIMVGQESEYKIVVENNSSETAQNLVVRTVIPDNVEITNVDASTGASHIGGNDAGGTTNDSLVCYWHLGNFDPGKKETLVFRFTPRIRNNINFVTTYDYDKTALSSGITVTEPVIELTIEGNDTIEWGAAQRYCVNIRNTGDGKAQNVRLTVSTGDNDNATRILKTLAPGEEKKIDLNMKTVLDNYLMIRADAEADYGFSASTEKSIDILRGDLDIFVESSEVQFVNDTADYVVHICNTGRAPLSNVEVVAAIPTSIEILSAEGNPSLDNTTNQMIWTIPMIKPEEEISYQVSAKMLRAGNARIDVTAADKTGISCFGNTQIQIEAIAALEMKINKPTGAIATGKEVKYEVVISNSGTKAAEMIDAGFFLPAGMVPTAVEGGGKVVAEESKVLFNKINFLGPGQTVIYTVHAVAEERGNHKVQAVLESKADNIQLVSEEMNFFYDRKPSLAQREASQNESNNIAMNVKRPVSGDNPAKVAANSAVAGGGESSSPATLPGPRIIR